MARAYHYQSGMHVTESWVGVPMIRNFCVLKSALHFVGQGSGFDLNFSLHLMEEVFQRQPIAHF